MSMLQKGVALILIHSLTNSGANIGQYCCIYNGGLVKDESNTSKPKTRESNKKYSVWFNAFNLAVPDIGEIQGQKSFFDIKERRGRPEKLENDTLPYFLFRWAMEEKMARRIINIQTNRTEGKIENSRHDEIQEAAIGNAPCDEAVYHITLNGGK